jgi:glutathione synthase/RimK-type ligase-like ATP-grasp enzyme
MSPVSPTLSSSAAPRLGIVLNFLPTAYALGDALGELGLPIVRLHLPDTLVQEDGTVTVAGAYPAVDAVLWRVSEGLWPACAPLAVAYQTRTPVLNPVSALAVCGDKLATDRVLRAAGVPVVASVWVPPGGPVPDLGPRTVLKPAHGANGRGVVCPAPGTVLDLMLPSPMLAQAWAGGCEDHLRILVAGGVVVCAYLRLTRGGSLPNNVSAGGVRHPVDPPMVACEVALAAAEATGTVLAGVDLVKDAVGGWQVLEVNGTPGMPVEVVGRVAVHLVAAVRAALT